MISLLILLVLNSVSTEPIQDGQCGISNAPASRITGGHRAKLGAWPWMAAVGYKLLGNVNTTIWLCGASLISIRYVVTAAHCVWMEPESVATNVVTIRLGEFDLNNTDDGANPVDYDVEEIIVYEHYIYILSYSDIALLRLASDVTFTDEIRPICLPLSPSLRNSDFVGTYAFVTGWGSSALEIPTSDILLEVEVPIVNHTYCRSSYFVTYNIITKKDICAGEPEGGKDSCQGDSGGPLMVEQSGVYYLIGIVKAGYGCGLPGYPGIYTRVTAFNDWIEDIINEM